MFVAGGLGANPHPALALEEFTPREELLPTLEAILRVFNNHGNRDNKLRARMKWLVDTMGWDELQARVLKERRFLLASSSWPGGIPAIVDKHGDAPAGVANGATPTPMGQGTPVAIRCVRSATALGRRQRRPRASPRAPCRPTPGPASATSPPTSSARWPASSASSAPRCGSPTARTSSSGASPSPSCPRLHDRLDAIGMAEPGAELAATSSPARVPTPATWRSRSPGAWPTPSATASRKEGWPRSAACAPTSPAAPTRCGQHHTSDIGFFGAERRAHGQAAPGYQMLLGGYVGQEQIHFGEKALRLPAKNAPEAAVRVVGRFAAEREAGRGLPLVAGPGRWRQGGRRRPEGPRRLPHPRRGARVLRRLRRDRPLRGRDRRLGVRDMNLEPHRHAIPSFTDDELAELNRRVRAPARVEDHPVGGRHLRPSPLPDRLDDRRGAHRPGREGRPGHRGRVHRHRLPLPRDAGDRRAGPPALRPQPADDDRADPRRGALAASTPRMLLGRQGRPARPGPRRQGRPG